MVAAYIQGYTFAFNRTKAKVHSPPSSAVAALSLAFIAALWFKLKARLIYLL